MAAQGKIYAILGILLILAGGAAWLINIYNTKNKIIAELELQLRECQANAKVLETQNIAHEISITKLKETVKSMNEDIEKYKLDLDNSKLEYKKYIAMTKEEKYKDKEILKILNTYNVLTEQDKNSCSNLISLLSKVKEMNYEKY